MKPYYSLAVVSIVKRKAKKNGMKCFWSVMTLRAPNGFASYLRGITISLPPVMKFYLLWVAYNTCCAVLWKKITCLFARISPACSSFIKMFRWVIFIGSSKNSFCCSLSVGASLQRGKTTTTTLNCKPAEPIWLGL